MDLALTPELIQMGVLREVIRAVQEERKRIGLDISDRITVNWNATEQIALAIIESETEISSEVLATKMVRQSKQSNSDNELGLWLELIKS